MVRWKTIILTGVIKNINENGCNLGATNNSEFENFKYHIRDIKQDKIIQLFQKISFKQLSSQQLM